MDIAKLKQFVSQHQDLVPLVEWMTDLGEKVQKLENAPASQNGSGDSATNRSLDEARVKAIVGEELAGLTQGHGQAHHLCGDAECVTCRTIRAEIEEDVIGRLSSQVPGVEEALSAFRLNNTPVQIAA